MKEYLPLGSVVYLHEGDKKIMIYGRKQKAVASGKEYDYIACLFPEGNIDENYCYLFNHEDIREVLFRGYVDFDEQEFVQDCLQDD
ncbi:DUF4176 domain-containing protein [Caproiciproducens galactitolivorans]|uniref:DUF4176 domain-containing protein n=1 Tax=Caproiciproducens galactitolivorans TaxID=642589 RepID=A0ABT4BR98_9FIRM|nr:DUF4176 domain-containing protein [Caproiciproducens galactitolivorans]MCY1713421.1 DUF4176 domain-containing protein [Caproiciproducens galactitolivorans]